MAKSTPSQLDRSRPSSRLQAQTMLETTPVLFRLPSVQLQPLPPVADMPTESLMEFAAAPMPEASPSPASLPVSITSQPMEADEPPRTWWEHWSSGVILILLLVAAYFACIAVLRSRGRAGSNTIATDSSSKSEFGDLNDIKIPPVSNATGNTTPGNQLNQPAALTANDSSAADALVNSLVSPPNGNSLSNDNGNTLTLENPAKELAQPLATAQLLEPLQMPNNSLQLLNDRDVSNNNGVQAQSASMQLGQSPSLYDGASNNARGLNPLAEPSLPPFTPASLNPNSFALDTTAPSLSPALSNTALTSPTLSSPALSSPALSSPALSSPAASGSTTYGQAYPASPTIPNLVAGTTNPSSTNFGSTNPSGPNPGAPSLGVNASTVSTQQLPAGQATSSNVRTTVTPEANGEVESIIKAYVDLMRAGQASQSANTQNAPANRYQPVR